MRRLAAAFATANPAAQPNFITLSRLSLHLVLCPENTSRCLRSLCGPSVPSAIKPLPFSSSANSAPLRYLFLFLSLLSPFSLLPSFLCELCASALSFPLSFFPFLFLPPSFLPSLLCALRVPYVFCVGLLLLPDRCRPSAKCPQLSAVGDGCKLLAVGCFPPCIHFPDASHPIFAAALALTPPATPRSLFETCSSCARARLAPPPTAVVVGLSPLATGAFERNSFSSPSFEAHVPASHHVGFLFSGGFSVAVHQAGILGWWHRHSCLCSWVCTSRPADRGFFLKLITDC